MRIERIDDKTVKCFLSNEELEEYEIDYKDFVTRSDRAREVVQEIIEQAEEEVGYRPPKFAFDLQIMVVPEQGMVLTFSEKDPIPSKEGEQLLECLKNMKQALQKTKEQIGIMGETQKPEAGSEGKGAEQQNKEAPSRPEEAVLVFDRLAFVMDYAAALPPYLRVSSALYGLEGKYYLHLCRGAASYARFGKICVQALEFGSLYAAEEAPLRHLKEHGECLITKQALNKLRKG